MSLRDYWAQIEKKPTFEQRTRSPRAMATQSPVAADKTVVATVARQGMSTSRGKKTSAKKGGGKAAAAIKKPKAPPPGKLNKLDLQGGGMRGQIVIGRAGIPIVIVDALSCDGKTFLGKPLNFWRSDKPNDKGKYLEDDVEAQQYSVDELHREGGGLLSDALTVFKGASSHRFPPPMLETLDDKPYQDRAKAWAVKLVGP